MMRFALLLLCALPFPAVARAAVYPAAQSQQLAQIERVTQKIRQLNQIHTVKTYFLNNQAFNAEVRRNLQELDPESEIEISQRELVLLGQLKKSDNLHDITFNGLTSQVLGLYDYFNRALYVRRDGNQIFGVERYAIAHEYTHALQDQHYSLKKLMPDQNRLAYRNSDAVSAHHALTEGDAVLTQTLFISRTYSPQDVRDLIKFESQPQKTPPIPKAIERSFLFPYTTAVNFVKKLYDTGGMSGVSAAYARLPSSTYEIMHPNAYLNHWQPVAVRLHAVQGFSEWKQVDDDVLGAFGYDLLLWQFLPRSTADRVTGAYRGDRYVFLENGSQNAMLLKSMWTSAAAAGAAKSALLDALKKHYPGMHTSGGQATIVTEPDGGIYLRSSRSSLTVAIAPTTSLAQELGTARTS